MSELVAFPELDREFLGQRIEESIAVVKKALATTDKPKEGGI
jgi:hypothetical protein